MLVYVGVSFYHSLVLPEGGSASEFPAITEEQKRMKTVDSVD